jgi:hypothetical protein
MKDFPLLDPSILDENEYPNDLNYSYSTFGRKPVDFMFSKGCFRNCEFCVAGTQRTRLSVQDYERVDEQLRIFREHGFQEIIVQDDAFLPHGQGKKEHVRKTLGLMKKYGFYWQNNGGLDFEELDDEVTRSFVDYNREGDGRVTSLYVPFNPRQWNKGKSAAGTMIGKHQEYFENLRRLRKEGGIYVFTSEIIGTPEHSVETMEHDIELHKQMVEEGYLDAALTLSATLLPGTKWNMENRENIVNPKDYAGYSLFTTHHRTERIPDPSVIEAFMVRRAKEMNEVQKTYSWGSAFPNAEHDDEKKRESVSEITGGVGMKMR